MSYHSEMRTESKQEGDCQSSGGEWSQCGHPLAPVRFWYCAPHFLPMVEGRAEVDTGVGR